LFDGRIWIALLARNFGGHLIELRRSRIAVQCFRQQTLAQQLENSPASDCFASVVRSGRISLKLATLLDCHSEFFDSLVFNRDRLDDWRLPLVAARGQRQQCFQFFLSSEYAVAIRL